MTNYGRAPIAPENIGNLSPEKRALTSVDLLHALDVSKAFNNDQSIFKGEYLEGQFDDFEEVARRTPGYLGVFATGYPFYANRADGSIVAIEEIDRYIGTVEDRLLASRKGLGNWACVGCQLQRTLPDLKTLCRPCDEPQIKPRDIFKALPDLDFWVILDEAGTHKEDVLRANLQNAGFYPSDIDIFSAVKDTIEVCEDVTAGRAAEKRLPIDLHVVTKTELIDALTDVRHIVRDVYKPEDINEDNEVPITPRSLHINWERVDRPYDFMKDFLFSMTTKGLIDPEIVDSIDATKGAVKECLSPQDIIDLIGAYPKEMRQMRNTEVQSILLDKWKVAA